VIRRLDENCWVAGQIAPRDLVEIATKGVRTIVNNRPDGEEPLQPASIEIAAAARAAEMAYFHIPVEATFNEAQVREMAEALEQGPVLAFCRSGTRSTYLWALARASEGAEAEALAQQAAEAGYDLTPLLPYLTR
jgi:uncharacterized protein (TIGR01244 family)